jgi:hypothetical protein
MKVKEFVPTCIAIGYNSYLKALDTASLRKLSGTKELVSQNYWVSGLCPLSRILNTQFRLALSK